MTRQVVGNPIWLDGLEGDSRSRRLRRVPLKSLDHQNRYDEAWVQDLVFRHPEILPVDELDPAFGGLVPVCREMPTTAGPIDALFVNEDGLLTLVECKLWRNPEARREVVGQILDYAKELSSWSYEDLTRAVGGRGAQSPNPLFDQVREHAEVDEVDFVDRVSRNLDKGNFLLLIVGDGIREGVENITHFLQRHAGLHFTFGLVELAVFEAPENEPGYLVQPRLLARTTEIERAVVTVERGVQIDEPEDQRISHRQAGKKGSISEEEFYEELRGASPQAAKLLPAFLQRCEELGLTITRRRSIILNWISPNGDKHNFGTFMPDGTLRTNYVAWKTDEVGHPELGEQYLDEMAQLFQGGSVRRRGLNWTWKVVVNDRDPDVTTLLADHQDEWLQLIETLIAGLSD